MVTRGIRNMENMPGKLTLRDWKKGQKWGRWIWQLGKQQNQKHRIKDVSFFFFPCLVLLFALSLYFSDR